jgi:polysaccharide biosynthesis PFTS motif protein
MRGYRKLNELGQMDLLIRIKDDITNTRLIGIERGALKLFFGAGLPKAEIILRQFLIYRLLGLDFNKKLLIAIGKNQKYIYAPMPYEWRLVLEKYGFQSNTFHNKILWIAHVIYYYVFGVYVGTLALINGLCKNKDIRNSDLSHNSVYFQGLIPNNIPQRKNEGDSYDVITWFNNWNSQIQKIDYFTHSVKNVEESNVSGIKVKYVNSAITDLNGLFQIFKYIFGLFQLFLISFFDLIMGKYWHALLLSESCRSFHFRILDKKQISKHYLFHNIDYLYKPIWTYDAEAKGAKVSLYFYSCNIERFKDENGYNTQPNSWQIISWLNYLVWDKYHADFIKRMTGCRSNIEIVGPINFLDSSVDFLKLPKNTVLVFDVQPQRDEHYQTYCTVPEYIVPQVVNSFLEDIFLASKNSGFIMALKRKRHIGKLLNSKYKIFIERLEQEENFISIDPDVAAVRLIKNVEIVISIPFTSTALIAKAEGKISIYYDPSGLVQKDDRGAHGIEIISGIEELKNWFLNIKKINEIRS